MKEFNTEDAIFLEIIKEYDNGNKEKAFELIKDFYSGKRDYVIGYRSLKFSDEVKEKLDHIREEYEKYRILSFISPNELEMYKILLHSKIYNNIENFMELYNKTKHLKISFKDLEKSIKKRGIELLYSKDEILRIKSIAIEYINFYFTNKEELDKKIKKSNNEDFLPIAEKTLVDYLNGNFKSIYEYCLLRDCDNVRFKKYLEILKEHNSDLYKKYEEKTNENKVNINELISTWKTVLNGIKNGKVKKDNSIREYDALDYFLDSKYPYDIMIKHLELFASKEEIVVFKNFIINNKIEEGFRKINIDKFLESDIELFALKDKNGLPIKGSGRTLTKEEIKNIIDFIHENNLPESNIIFGLVCDRYLKGEIKLTAERAKVKNLN